MEEALSSAAECKLFDDIIFGPVHSRRLGLSLGINLLPLTVKACNYNCIYCECGWTAQKHTAKGKLCTRHELAEELFNKLMQMKEQGQAPDAITFAGNGEPTLHPDFPAIMKEVVNIRNAIFPHVKIAVLSNGVALNRQPVVEALKLADERIMKLDAGTEETFRLINQPAARRSLRWMVDHLLYFKGDLSLQTMFLQGYHNGVKVDNTTPAEINAWLELVKEINPKRVMIYSLDRPSPSHEVNKVPAEVLEAIAMKVNELGIETMVS